MLQRSYLPYPLLLFVCALLLSGTATAQPQDTPQSKALSKRLLQSMDQGFTYPDSAEVVEATFEMGKLVKHYSEANCVEFIYGVFQLLFPDTILDRGFKDKVYINSLGGYGLAQAVTKRIDEVRGVQWALEYYGMGRAIAREKVRVGDFVQYWYKRKNGKWGGHVAVVMEVHANGKLDLYSSNRSTAGPDYLRNYNLRSNAYFARLWPAVEVRKHLRAASQKE